MLYAALECARILVLEGLDAAVERHRRHGAAMVAGVAALGLELFGDQAHKMHNVVGVEIPGGRRRRGRAGRPARRASASRSARRSVRCTGASGASAPWATTPGPTPSCARSAHSSRCWHPRRSTGHRPSRGRRRGVLRRRTPDPSPRSVRRVGAGTGSSCAAAVVWRPALRAARIWRGSSSSLTHMSSALRQPSRLSLFGPTQRGARRATDTFRSDGQPGWEKARVGGPTRARTPCRRWPLVALLSCLVTVAWLAGSGSQSGATRAHHDHPCRDAHHRDRTVGRGVGTRPGRGQQRGSPPRLHHDHHGTAGAEHDGAAADDHTAGGASAAGHEPTHHDAGATAHAGHEPTNAPGATAHDGCGTGTARHRRPRRVPTVVPHASATTPEPVPTRAEEPTTPPPPSEVTTTTRTAAVPPVVVGVGSPPWKPCRAHRPRWRVGPSSACRTPTGLVRPRPRPLRPPATPTARCSPPPCPRSTTSRSTSGMRGAERAHRAAGAVPRRPAGRDAQQRAQGAPRGVDALTVAGEAGRARHGDQLVAERVAADRLRPGRRGQSPAGLDPDVGWDRRSAIAVAGLSTALIVVTGFAEALRIPYLRRRGGPSSHLRVFPLALVAAILLVVLSRGLGLRPGLIFGVTCGLALAGEESPTTSMRAAASRSAVRCPAGGDAGEPGWPGARLRARHPGPTLAPQRSSSTPCVSTVWVSGLQAVLFGLLPLTFLAGERVLRWNRWGWIALYATALFLFVDAVLRPGSSSPRPHRPRRGRWSGCSPCSAWPRSAPGSGTAASCAAKRPMRRRSRGLDTAASQVWCWRCWLSRAAWRVRWSWPPGLGRCEPHRRRGGRRARGSPFFSWRWAATALAAAARARRPRPVLPAPVGARRRPRRPRPARLSRTIGVSAKRSSLSYHPTIWVQSVSSGVRRVGMSAAIAACVWYSPS